MLFYSSLIARTGSTSSSGVFSCIFAREIHDVTNGWAINNPLTAATFFRAGCWTMRAARQLFAPVHLVRPEEQPLTVENDES
jgi:hypothetical protein